MEPDRYVPLPRALIPSRTAGLDVLNRFRAYMNVLDELSEPLIFLLRTAGNSIETRHSFNC